MDEPTRPTRFTPNPPEGTPVRPISVNESRAKAVSAPEAPAMGMSVGDIYYVLFRHKWKIIACSLLGIVAAAVFYKLNPPPFQSEARLLIRYVVDTQSPGASGNDIRTADQSGETIINTEVEILTSLDLTLQVAKSVGPEKVLKNGSTDLMAAAAVIQSGLMVENPFHTSVLHVVFAHPDPAVVQPVLTEIIDQYLKRHVEIHRASGSGFLASETDQLKARLTKTEEELRKARNKVGITNLDDAKKTYAEQIARLKQDISRAQADYAERSAVLQELTKQSSGNTNVENPAPADLGPDPTPEQLKQYRNLLVRQDALSKREQDLLTYFREDNPRVKDIRTQLEDLDTAKKNMEAATPKLSHTIVPLPSQGGGAPSGTSDLATESARLNALQTKIKVLTSQLEGVRAEAENTDQMEITILQLTRQKELEEANYKKYAQNLEQTRINDALGTNGTSNISEIQSPSPPYSDAKKIKKKAGMMAFAGIAAGLAWAILIEFFLDRSVRKPGEIERVLRLPLFLSIPKLAPDQLLLKPRGADVKQLTAGSPPKDGKGGWEMESALHPFHETLRDRLISYFESKGLIHKPKLVAVTGISRGSGVTTTAAGLASSLSETGDGNVLLVDMTQGQGSAQQFYKGKAVCGLEEILDTRDNAQIDDNLYVVGQEPGGEKLSRILPHRFNKLVPKLKASNFDYIIFDMPPVNQISITPRLTSFMDMVLLVIESEKTDRELVQRATALLAESKAHVGAVLNKNKTYVPPKLFQESLGNG